MWARKLTTKPQENESGVRSSPAPSAPPASVWNAPPNDQAAKGVSSKRVWCTSCNCAAAGAAVSHSAATPMTRGKVRHLMVCLTGFVNGCLAQLGSAAGPTVTGYDVPDARVTVSSYRKAGAYHPTVYCAPSV